MNARTTTALLCVVLLACCAALLLYPTAQSSPAAALPDDSLRTPTERVDGAFADGATGTRSNGSVDPAAAERTPPSHAADARAPRAIVRGRLIDGSGRPRVGIAVRITSWSLPDATDRDDIEFVSGGRAPVQRPTAWTDADGGFRLPLAVDRCGEITLPDVGLVFAEKAPRAIGKAGDQDLGDIVVDRASTLQGMVVDQDGEPVARVEVRATTGESPILTRSTARTAADGTFTLGGLRAGTWTLRTSSDRFLPAIERFTLAREERRANLIVQLRPGRAVAGRVVDDRGVPVEGMRVQSRRAAGNMIVSRQLEVDAGTSTDQHGCFVLTGLAEPLVTLHAFGPGHSGESVADVPVGTGDLLIRLERLAVLEGVLSFPDGTPIAGSVVAALAPGESSIDRQPELAEFIQLGNYRASATTDADGRFRIASAPAGALTLMARGKGHRLVLRGGLHARPGQVLEDIRLVADRGAVLRVTVVDEGGEPVGGADLRISRAADPNDPRAAWLPPLALAAADDRGTAVVSGLPAGAATVDASHAAFADAAPIGVVVPTTGEIHACLTMRRPGFAAIRVLAADSAASPRDTLRITGPAAGGTSGPSRRATTDADGNVLVGPLSPGAYTVRLTRSSSEASLGDAVLELDEGRGSDILSSTQPFAVAGGETTRVELRRPVLTTVHGVVSGVDGPVPGCVVSIIDGGAVDFGLPGVGGRSVTTGADGSFRFAAVESGTCSLRHGRPGQVVLAVTELLVPPGRRDLRQDLVLRTGRLRVQVCDADTNAPVHRAEVELIVRGRAGAAGVPHARTTEQGWAQIDEVPAGDYVLHVRHEDYVAKTTQAQSVHEASTTECEHIPLSRAGQIRGNVHVPEDVRPGAVVVEARPAGTAIWSAPTQAESGAYRLAGLAPGKYLIRARTVSHTGTRCSPEVEVAVEPGATSTIDLRLPRE